MNFNHLFQSKRTRILLVFIGTFIILLLAFEAGVIVGYHKASFSDRWGGNYSRLFGERHEESMPGLPSDSRFSSAHGASGKVIRVELPVFTLADQDGVEKNILVRESSIVRRFRDTVSARDIHPDDFAVVIGSPNDDGQIEARFIRLLTMMPPEFVTSSSTTSSFK